MVKSSIEILIKELEQLPEDRREQLIAGLLTEIRGSDQTYRDIAGAADWEFWHDPEEDLYQEYLKK
jgi:hypothetical protein